MKAVCCSFIADQRMQEAAAGLGVTGSSEAAAKDSCRTRLGRTSIRLVATKAAAAAAVSEYLSVGWWRHQPAVPLLLLALVLALPQCILECSAFWAGKGAQGPDPARRDPVAAAAAAAAAGAAGGRMGASGRQAALIQG
jgi:hypothetical protein